MYGLAGLQWELHEFDKKHTAPLPKPLYDWRNRWVKAIEQATMRIVPKDK